MISSSSSSRNKKSVWAASEIFSSSLPERIPRLKTPLSKATERPSRRIKTLRPNWYVLNNGFTSTSTLTPAEGAEGVSCSTNSSKKLPEASFEIT